MKKLRLIVVAIFGLITTMVVSSFAWFQLKNNGILSEDVNTRREIDIYFSEDGNGDGFMRPAKLKKGVINDPSGSIVGDGTGENESVPMGRKVLPSYDEENFTYNVVNGELVPQSEYLESPATIVYSQFELLVDAEENSGTKTLNMEFEVKYFNVDADDTDLSNATPFAQDNALSFNFFVLEQELTNEELETISTHVGAASSNKLIERFIVDNQIPVKNNSGTISYENEVTYSSINNYRYNARPTKEGEKVTYSTSFSGLDINRAYYIILESYYNVPDQLVEGNLPLTGKFVLDLNYTL